MTKFSPNKLTELIKSVQPDLTALKGADWSGFTLFAGPQSA